MKTNVLFCLKKILSSFHPELPGRWAGSCKGFSEDDSNQPPDFAAASALVLTSVLHSSLMVVLAVPLHQGDKGGLWSLVRMEGHDIPGA